MSDKQDSKPNVPSKAEEAMQNASQTASETTISVHSEVAMEASPAGKDTAQPGDEEFEAPVRNQPVVDVDALIINLDGYEGPLDVLLELARTQKVDIRKISMLALVEQYLLFIEAARQSNLELAADYLVMASWLAYLKSKLLLPKPEENGEEPTADEMAARLAFQLQRLEAMRKATENLYKLPRLGINVFPRGCPEGVRVTRTPDWQADLFDLLKAYTTQRVATVDRDYKPEKPKVFTLEDARVRLSRILGMIPDWQELRGLSPLQDVDAPESSVIASAFHAALEFAKDGQIDLRQLGHFEPIYVRRREAEGEAGSNEENTGSISNLPEPGGDQSTAQVISDATHEQFTDDDALRADAV